MEINGLKLPRAFIEDLQSGRLHREIGCWELIKNQSAFGEPLEMDLSEVFADPSHIQKATDELENNFCCISEEDVEGYTEIYGIAPGEIPYIWNFSKIVCFAEAGDAAPICFDYRDSEQQPRVIWWADAYWQRVAPNYETFIQLFDISDAI